MAVAERGFRVTCIEPDSALANQITARGLEVLPDISQIASGEVDNIFSLNVLEHIADDKAAAKAWAEKLKPGGRLLVYVPAFPWLFTSMDRKVGHLRRYTRRVLVDLLTAAQFQVVSARYADSLGVIATLAYRLLDPGTGEINEQLLRAYDRLVFPVSRVLDNVFAHYLGKNLIVTAVRSGR